LFKITPTTFIAYLCNRCTLGTQGLLKLGINGDLLDLGIRKIWDAFLSSPQLWQKGVQALG
jgi:predicted DsbA family dithiol-disulfide isomerase